MSDPVEEDRRLEEEAGRALSRLKQHADYPAIHLRVIEDCEALVSMIGLTLPKPELPSPERLEYAIKLMDAWASGYVGLVRTITDQEDFTKLLSSYVRKAWKIYRGIAEIEPLNYNRDLAAIEARRHYWYKESLRRLVPEATKATAKMARRGYRTHIRGWMKREGLTSVAQAAKSLAVSESTLKSIMSDKGEVRYSKEKLAEILEKTGYIGE